MTQPIPYEVQEDSSATWTGYIRDAAGVAIASADIVALTITLYDKLTGTAINTRTAQDILNANNVTVHATSGLITWEIQPLDNVIVGTTLKTNKSEEHVALIEGTYDTSKKFKKEIKIKVVNLEKVS